jgi:hypothetical protein
MPAGSAARQARGSMTTARAPRFLPILRGTWTEEARTRGMLPGAGAVYSSPQLRCLVIRSARRRSAESLDE